MFERLLDRFLTGVLMAFMLVIATGLLGITVAIFGFLPPLMFGWSWSWIESLMVGAVGVLSAFGLFYVLGYWTERITNGGDQTSSQRPSAGPEKPA